MATLFNTKISATYVGLLKTIDNAVLSATLRELTDGSGNQSGLFLNTAGDFKVTSVLEWGSLKDTGTGVTITQFVTAANGIENFNNDTTLPTSAAVKLYVDTKFSQTDTLTEVLGFGNTTSGKDIAVSAGDDVTFTDTSKAIFGTSSEFEIFQDTADSRITTLSNLYIQTPIFRVQKVGGEQMIEAISDNGVKLYFNNVKKFETTLLGSTITGDLLVTGSITGAGGSFLPLAGGIMTGNTIHNDNVKSIYGTLGDGLEIFHDGTHSYLEDTGTGDLRIKTNGASIALLAPSNEDMVLAVPNSFVKLYFNNSEKLATNITGVNVTGNLSTTANVNVGANATFVDNGKALFGDSNDLEIFHNSGTNSNTLQSNNIKTLALQQDSIQVLNQSGSELMIGAIADGAVSLYFNGSKKLETVSDGAKVTGNLEVTGTITGAGGSFLPLIGGTMTGNTIHNDNVKSIYGTASDGLEIYHDSLNSVIRDQGTGNMVLAADDFRLQVSDQTANMITANTGAEVKLMFNGGQKLATTNTGISVTGNGVFSGNVTIPDAGQLQLGTGNDAQIYHDTSNFYAKNLVGALNIEQAAITQSIVVKVSNSNALDTTALTINREGDLITGKDVTIAGDLTVNGTTTTVNSQTLSVVDPLISLATANTANSLDIGFYGKYNDSTNRYLGLFNDASDSNKFKLFRGTTVEPTTTVNIAGAGYVAADLVVAGLEGTTGVFSTSVTVATASPLIRLTDTDNNTNIDLLSIGGAFILNSTSDQIHQIGGLEKFRIGSSTSTFQGNIISQGTGTNSFVGNILMNNDAPVLTVNSSNGGSGFRVNVTGVASGNNSLFRLQRASTTVLTIQSDGDAIFTGNVTTGASLISSNIIINQITAKTANGNILVRNNGGSTIATFNNNLSASFAGGITATGGITANFFRTNAANADYNLITRDSTGNTVFIQAVQSNTNQPIAKFSYGSGTVNAGNAVLQVSKDNSHFVNCRLGIGNTAPEQLLHVGDGSDAARGVVAIEGAGGSHLIFSENSSHAPGANAYCLRPASGTNFIIQQDGSAASALTIDTGANATFAGIANANVIVARDNMFVGAGQFYIGGTTSEVDGSFRQVVGSGDFKLQKRISGTFTDALEIDTNLNAIFAENITATRGFFNSGGTNVVATFTSTDAQSSIKFVDSGGNAEIGCNGNVLTFQPAGGTSQLLVGESISTFVGNVGIGTGGFAQKPLDVSGATGGQLLITGANDAVGTTAGILLRAEGGESNGLARIKGGIFFERIAGSFGNGTLKFAVNGAVNNDAVTVADTAMTIDNSKKIIVEESISFVNDAPFRGAASIRQDSDILILTGGGNGFAFNDDTNAVSNLLINSGGEATFSSAVNIAGTLTLDQGSLLNGIINTPASLRINIDSNNNQTGEKFIVGHSQTNIDNNNILLEINESGAAEFTGNLGIGIGANSNYKLRIKSDASQADGVYISAGDSTSNHALYVETETGSAELFAVQGSGQIRMNASRAGNIIFGGTSIAAITGASPVGSGFGMESSNRAVLFQGTTSTGVMTMQAYYNPNGQVGRIGLNGSSTSYFTSSDYRLKEDLQDFTGLDKVSKISVYDFKWKADKKRSYGVIAHELQEVLPQAVSGDKDAKENQMVDYSKIVPLLVKSIQELKAEIELLKAK